MNNNVETNIPQLQYDDKLTNTDKGMANAFNNFFTKIGPELDQEIPKTKSNRDPTTYLNSRVTSSFLICPTDCNEIRYIIQTLDDTKSPGTCNIPTKFLKLARNEISTPFSDICNMSFSQGVFPEVNKIIPIHKKGSTKDVNNCRPISLLSIIEK